MTAPLTPTPSKQVTQQFVLTSLAEGALMVGIVLFFIIEPQTTLTIVLAAVASAVGLVIGIYAIYRAVPLMSEPATRMVGYISVALIVVGPLTLFAVSQFI
jgi:glucose uptake protein GlcU